MMSKETWRGKRYVPNRDVARRYGCHRTTLNRWLQDEALAFPKPSRIRGRNYWDEAALDAWDQANASRDLTAELAAEREKLQQRRWASKGDAEGEAA
jgi:predicted DNA-binding transcriptional regulator AlpA